jgi:hypothetical protein
MDEPIVKNYSFTQGVGKDGMPKYFIDGSEIRDKATWDRLKAKTNQVMDDVMKDSTAEFDAANPMPEMMKSPIVKKAKGGNVSSASRRADGCATKGKTKGRMI